MLETPWGGVNSYKLEQVTSVSAGEKYVFVQSGHAMSNTVSNSALQTVSLNNTTGLSGTESYVWTLETATGGFYMKNESLSSNKYLNNSSSTTVSFGSKLSIWTFTFTDGIALIQNKSNSNRFLGFTSSTSYAYKAYATSNLSSYDHAISVYKLVEESLTDNTITVTPSDGLSFILPTTETQFVTYSSNSSATFTFSNTDNTVANYVVDSENSKVTFTALKAGTTEFTISQEKNSTHKAASTSFTVTVTDPREDHGLAYSDDSYEAVISSSNSFPALSNANNLSPITYSSTNETVATINSTGVITLLAPGTTTISASFAGNETYKSGNASYELTVSTPVDNTVTYTKITNASDLADGDIIIFVYEGDNCAMGAAKTNNYDIQTISINEGIASLSSGLTEITLVKDGNYWRFKVGDNSYLYAAGGTSSNYLKASTLGTEGDNGKASISISNGNATIIFQGNNSADYRCSLRYNISSDLFACYKSSSSNTDYPLVQIYRKESTHTLNSADGGAYATMYYSNQSFLVPEGVTAKTYKLVGSDLKVSMVYEAGDVIPADEAVVLSGTAGNKIFKVALTDVEKDPNNALKGSDDPEMTTGGDKYYALSLDKTNANIGFYWMEAGGAAFMNGPHKAYLALPSSIEVKSFYTFFDAETTVIETVEDTSPNKFKGIYTIHGQRVNNTLKGLYIVNGKKVYIK